MPVFSCRHSLSSKGLEASRALEDLVTGPGMPYTHAGTSYNRTRRAFYLVLFTRLFATPQPHPEQNLPSDRQCVLPRSLVREALLYVGGWKILLVGCDLFLRRRLKTRIHPPYHSFGQPESGWSQLLLAQPLSPWQKRRRNDQCYGIIRAPFGGLSLQWLGKVIRASDYPSAVVPCAVIV